MTERRLAFGLAVLLLLLATLRFVAATRVGFGDSEALYACYSLHPAPAYLDHPGLVGLFARLLGRGTAPTPTTAHLVTGTLATLFPLLFAVVARAFGASSSGSLVAALVVAVVPAFAVGLFALTPDLLLAFCWLASLGLAAFALGGSERRPLGSAALLGAGLLAGVAAASKVSGLLLLLALAVAYMSPAARPHRRTLWPWAGLVLGVVVFLPVVSSEVGAGFPMLRHRLVDTQPGAGVSLRNAAALVFGQLGYLSPLLALLAIPVARELWRSRRDDALTGLLAAAFAVPLVPLTALCLWSRVAEPHWLTPALLPLPLYYARTWPRLASPRRWLLPSAGALGLLFVLAVHAWVLVPDAARLRPAELDARVDIANELFGWPSAVAAVRTTLREARASGREPGELVVVGPYWTVCAQLHAALGAEVRVGCATSIKDDFDGWLPRATWRAARTIVYVTDNRFPGDGSALAPQHAHDRTAHVRVLRGGRTVRTFMIRVYERASRG